MAFTCNYRLHRRAGWSALWPAIFWVSLSVTYTIHSLEDDMWSGLQLEHLIGLSHVRPSWPSSEHLKHLAWPLHDYLPWPNFWHWKQRVVFGMYWSTLILYGSTLIVYGIDGDSKVNRDLFNLIIVPCFSYRKSFNIYNSLGFKFLTYFLFW